MDEADPARQKAANFSDWVRTFAHLWSHIHVSALAVRVEQDWVAIRMTAVLADEEQGNPPWGLPFVDEDRIMAFRCALPNSGLEPLLNQAIVGQLDSSSIPGLDRVIRLSVPGLGMKNPSFDVYSDSSGVTLLSSSGTRAEFTLQSEAPSSGPVEPWKAYGGIEQAERRFVRRAHGTLSRLGAALGLRIEKTAHIGNVWSSPLLTVFVAPIPARIAGLVHVRDKDLVRANIELGPLIPREHVTLAFRPDDHSAWFPPKSVRSRRRRIDVEVARRPPPGAAEVSLCIEPWGEVAKAGLTIDPPLKTWPFQFALCSIDPNNDLIAQGMAEGQGVTYERAVSALLALLGYAPVWWGPSKKKDLPPPTEAQPGATPDIYAWNEAKRELLIVEVTTGVIGSDKVTKLAGRTQRAQNRLIDVLGASAPRVRAVLAAGDPAGDLAPAAAASLEENGAGTLGRDVALELLRMIRLGCTREEVDDVFDQVFPARKWR
jgi:hypothetical protein